LKNNYGKKHLSTIRTIRRPAVQLAIKKLNGEPLEKTYLIPSPAITKQNADQFRGQF